MWEDRTLWYVDTHVCKYTDRQADRQTGCMRKRWTEKFYHTWDSSMTKVAGNCFKPMPAVRLGDSTSSSQPGGDPNHSRRCAKGLREAGHRICICCWCFSMDERPSPIFLAALAFRCSSRTCCNCWTRSALLEIADDLCWPSPWGYCGMRKHDMVDKLFSKFVDSLSPRWPSIPSQPVEGLVLDLSALSVGARLSSRSHRFLCRLPMEASGLWLSSTAATAIQGLRSADRLDVQETGNGSPIVWMAGQLSTIGGASSKDLEDFNILPRVALVLPSAQDNKLPCCSKPMVSAFLSRHVFFVDGARHGPMMKGDTVGHVTGAVVPAKDTRWTSSATTAARRGVGQRTTEHAHSMPDRQENWLFVSWRLSSTAVERCNMASTDVFSLLSYLSGPQCSA